MANTSNYQKPMQRILFVDFAKGVNLSFPDYNLDTLAIADISNLDLLPYQQLSVREPYLMANVEVDPDQSGESCTYKLHRFENGRGYKQILYYANGRLWELKSLPDMVAHPISGYIIRKRLRNNSFWSEMNV